MTIVLGYARVSTIGQNTDNQVERLRGAGCVEVFQETMSGTRNAHSAVFRSLFDRVAQLRDEGHEVEVLVTKLDRFSRTTRDLINSVMELAELGASFRALDNSLRYDKNDPTSKLMFHMFSALAEFERELIVSRTSEGAKAAKERGVVFGRPPVLTDEAVRRIREQFDTGLYTPNQLARREGVSRSTIHRVLGLYGAKPYMTAEEREDANRKAGKR